MSPACLDELDIVSRAPVVGGAAALSGAALERVTLADGRSLVFKQLPREGDWLTRVAEGRDHLRQLWDSGVLARVSETVDHAIITVASTEDGADVVVMRDVSDLLLPPDTTVPLSTARQLLAGLASLHAAWEGHAIPALCSLDARYRMLSPAWHAADTGPTRHPLREFILSGWEAFAELAPADVVQAVVAIHARPEALSRALQSSAPSTLLHGDAKLENLGLDQDRLVAIDWGDLSGAGPAEVDVTWFAAQAGWRSDVMPDETIAAYNDQAHRPLDPTALDLACIGALVWFGFKLAGRIRNSDDAARPRSELLLEWWVQRTREALSRWSPSL